MEDYLGYYSSPLGMLQVRSTENAVTVISFKESNEKELSCAVIDMAVRQLDEYFKGNRYSFDFPLAQPGTEFQQNVWKHLCQIPFGKTISYLQLSKQIGDVKAIRAIAAANGKNNIAIVVPCHRVIGSDAKLVGYAGGLWRKKWLLDHEAKYFSGVQTFDF